MRQNNDPVFGQILNKLRESSYTDDDVRETKSLVDTDTSHWPNAFVKVYSTNRRANIENERYIEKLKMELGRDLISLYAKDLAKDVMTQTLSVDNFDNQIHETVNLLGKLKVIIGARAMLSANTTTSNRLIKVLTGKIEYMQMPKAENNLVGFIYVKFGDVDAGNSLQNNLS